MTGVARGTVDARRGRNDIVKGSQTTRIGGSALALRD